MGKTSGKHRTMENDAPGPNGLIKCLVSKNSSTLLGDCRRFLQGKEKTGVGVRVQCSIISGV